ncbi:MAG TPA: hypothetical protein VG389_29545 [Myxococcota bacterium]|nr:hypothetical protein [Myxococcota bacterium]
MASALITLEDLIALKRAEAERAAPVPAAEVTPSRRDFAYYCATSLEELAVVPLLAARTPAGGELWPELQPAGAAARLAGGSAHALAVATDARFGGSLAALAAASAAADETPVLHYDFVLGAADLYAARAGGADAVWVHAFLHPPEVIADLMRTAASLHLAVVVGVRDDAELRVAAAARPRFLGVHAESLLGGAPDLSAARQLADAAGRAVPGAAVVLFGGVQTEADLTALHGAVDAVVLLAPLAARADLDALIDRING